MNLNAIGPRVQTSRNLAIGCAVTSGVVAAAVGIAAAVLFSRHIVTLANIKTTIPGVILITGASTTGLFTSISALSGVALLYFKGKKREAEQKAAVEAVAKLRQANQQKQALLEAERQRAEAAEKQKLEAERQRVKAEGERIEAERQRIVAERQRVEAAERRRVEAEIQRAASERQRMEAERQRIEQEAAFVNLEAQLIAQDQTFRDLEQHNTEPTHLITPQQIQQARDFCSNIANSGLIQKKLAEGVVTGVPFATLLPDETGLPYTLEYYSAQRILFSKLVTQEQIQQAKDYCLNPANADFINRKLLQARIDGLPFAALLPHETGLSHRLEYYGRNRIYLKYHKAFARGSFQVASKVVEIVSGHHFAEKQSVENLQDAEKYYATKRKLNKAQAYLPGTDYDKQTMENGRYNCERLANIPEILIETGHVQYSKTQNGFTIVKIHSYSVLQTGSVNFRAFSTDPQRKEATKAIVRAVAHYHRLDYCHHDIKGPNFLFRWINGRLRVKIIDYDFNSYANESVGAKRGTPIYMAPETVSSRNHGLSNHQINRAKDAWALGITIACDIYGLKFRWIEESTNILQFISNINTQAKAIDLSAIPSDVRKVVAGLLTFDPSQRLMPVGAHLMLNDVVGV